MDRHPASRRKRRSVRITVAVGLLAAATLVVAAAVWTRDARLEAGAAGLGLLAGWAALRLAWNTVLQSRYEHAVDRAAAAETYRQLFAERSVAHGEFVRTMDNRLTERQKLVEELGHILVDTQTRAAVAETSVKRFQRRLADAEGRIVTLEDFLARSEAETRAARTELTDLRARLATPMVETQPQSRVRTTVVPEWAHLETDPTAALIAWEEHAQHQARREAERETLQADESASA
jgi:septal ring factor EnvC (AmiA/AmiB activator)